MNSKELCMKLLRAETEDEVSAIIASDSRMSDPKNWHPLDNRVSNFNVVTNQASTGSKALTELCTNMVDAYLLKQAYLKNVPLHGPEAPQSVLEGVRRLAKITGMQRGRLFEVDDDRHLREFAEKNLVIGVNGGTRRSKPVCFTFVDTGEGQHGDSFKDTFLSLSSGHKSSIPFVQGKFNMGSSGVLSYCGEQWYKLIVSRRYTEDGPWAWTLIRRRPTTGAPIAEYFAPRKRIQVFKVARLYPLFLGSRKTDEFVAITSGSVVKLFNYFLEETPSFRNIRESLDRNLTSAVLPFRLMDYRFKPSPGRGRRRAQGVDERTFCGLEHHLMKRGNASDDAEESDDYEPGQEVHIQIIDHPDLGRISISAIVLEDKPPDWLRRNQDPFRVFHAVNGQVQFKQTRGYLASTCKLPGLMDKVVLIVDSSDLTEKAHNDVWKGDRENIRTNATGQTYKHEVTDSIRQSAYLKELQERLARKDVDETVAETTRNILQELVDQNPSVAQLLPEGLMVSVKAGPREPEPYVGKYDPTKLELIGRNLREHGIDVSIPRPRRIVFETDVVNDFLSRASNRGRADFNELEATLAKPNSRFAFRSNLRDGKLTVTIRAREGFVDVGDRYECEAQLSSDSMPYPVSAPFVINCVKSVPVRPPGPRPEPPNGSGTDESHSNAPQTVWLTRDGRNVQGESSRVWDERFSDFSDQDGGYSETLTEGVGNSANLVRFFINYDNVHLQTKLTGQRNEVSRKVAVDRYRWAMLLIMMAFEDAWRRNTTTSDRDLEMIEQFGEHIRRAVARGASTVALALTDDLPKIVNSAEAGGLVVE